MPNVKCLRCGSELLADGALYGPSRLALRPDDTRFLTMESGHVMTKATMCRECGFVEIVGDVHNLRRLIGHGASEAEPASHPVEMP
jgi:ribosomal protein S27AE